MNTKNLENLGASADQTHAMTQQFFEQMEPKVKKGRAWTFHRLNAACDTLDGERVQACFTQTTAKSSPCMPVRARLCTP